jgi:GT2 family glycosyltransferase
MVTIFSLIFQSPEYADWIWESVHKNTSEIKSGEAEFIIMLNNPTKEVRDHVIKKKYKYAIHFSPDITEEELIKLGYGGPTYLYSVYSAYNLCLELSKTEYTCLLNSDMYPSQGWLTGLLKYANANTIVTSSLVEPRRQGNIFTNFITRKQVHAFDGGYGIKDFNFTKFEKFANLIARQETEDLISYQPIMIHKDIVDKVGLYPRGNVLSDSIYSGSKIRMWKDKWIEYGDMYFIRKARNLGVKCIQSNESVVYHFDNGERLNK